MKPATSTYMSLGLLTVVVLTVVFGPIVMTAISAFVPLRAGTFLWSQANVNAFESISQNDGVMEALRLTVVVGVVASTLAIVISTSVALYCASGKGVSRKLIEFAIFLPFVMPPMITGLSLLIFFRDISVPRSILTILAGHTVLLLAVAYRTIVTRLRGLSSSLMEASLDLGANRWQTFWLIVLPNLRPALITSFILCFALSFDETLVTLLLTEEQSTFPVRLWAMMRLGFSPSVSALAVIILVVTALVSLVTIQLIGRPKTP